MNLQAHQTEPSRFKFPSSVPRNPLAAADEPKPWENPEPIRVRTDAPTKATTATLSLGLQPKQARAYRSKATEQLFGGAAGGGKSHLMRAAAILWAMEIPGLQVFLFRRLYSDLIINHMQGKGSFPDLLAPLVDSGHCQIVKGEIRFWNGSRIFLCHCQNAKALLKYQGAQIHVLLFDELTHFSERMYRFLRARCRLTIPVPPKFKGLFPRILSGANPGGEGHIWVKKTFVSNGEYKIVKASKKEGGSLRQFIPSRLEDNRILLESDPEYETKLEGLGDPVLIRAMREGDWDIVAGAMFGDVWRKNKHVCPPFAIPIHWELWRGADDGFADPFACYWFTQNPKTGTIYVIDELYATGLLPAMAAERVKKIDLGIPMISATGDYTECGEILRGMLDSAAFSNTGTGTIGQRENARGDQMNALGCRWTKVEKGKDSRMHRAQNLHRLLAPNMREPKRIPGIVFFDTCKQAIETIPQLLRDEKRIEVVADSPYDHSFDGVTYGLQYKKSGFQTKKVVGL